MASLASAFVASTAATAATPAVGGYATGGAGLYRDAIQWFNWGEDKAGIPNAGETRTNTFQVGGQTLGVTCSLSNIASSGNATNYLSAYRSGDYTGDSFDDLYNVGGTGTNNTLVAGLEGTASGSTTTFDFSCSATLGASSDPTLNAAFPLNGLVMADAESTNSTEYLSATIPASGTWRVIDRNIPTGNCAGVEEDGTVNASNTLKLTSTGQCTSGGPSPGAVAYMDGTTSATAVTVKGDGLQAIALGVFIGFDHGDAPWSYGDAAHAEQYDFTGGTLATGTTTDLTTTSFALATPVQPAPRLGAVVDPDATGDYTGGAFATTATGDDMNNDPGFGGVDDEDSMTAPSTIAVLPGDTYTSPAITCVGPGVLSGWIDWNVNGTFDAEDQSSTVACPAGTSSQTLQWTVPVDAQSSTSAAPSYLRVRLGQTGWTPSATGVALAGEAEDYAVQLDVAQPFANPDTATTPYLTSVVIDAPHNDVAPNGSTLVLSSVKLLDGGTPVTTLTNSDGQYTVDATSGKVTFTPAAGVTGALTPVPYEISDSVGQTAHSTITVTVTTQPTANPDTATTPQNVPVTLSPAANDTAQTSSVPIVASSVRIVDPLTAALETSLTITNEGSYSVDTSTGDVTFTPVASFTGTATPIAYSVADSSGARAQSTITITVTPIAPTATADSASTTENVAVVIHPLANDTAGAASAPLDPTTVKLIDPTSHQPVTSATVTGKGTFVVDATTGDVTFTPATGYVGPVPAIGYTVRDSNGTSASSTITVTVGNGPAAQPDSATTPHATAVNLPILDNDTKSSANAAFDVTTVKLIDPADNTAKTSVLVSNVGQYIVQNDGPVTFTPYLAFAGTAPALTYTVSDTNGVSTSSTITVTVLSKPTASPDTATTPQGVAVTLDPSSNDTATPSTVPLVATSVRLLDSSNTPQTSLVITGEGTYSVDTTTGKVTFSPLPTFTGAVTRVDYRVSDSSGQTATSTIDVTVTAVSPTANPDSTSTPVNTAVVISPSSNDTAGAATAPLVASSVRLIDPDTTSPTYGMPVTSVSIAGKGTFTVSTGTGVVTFSPITGFVGAVPAVQYTVQDSNGTSATSTITVTVVSGPVAKPDTKTTYQNVATTVSPADNDIANPSNVALDATSVRLIDSSGSTPTLVTTLQVTDEGSYSVDTSTGHVTFTPVAAFTGTATAVAYRITDANGQTADSTITITVTPVTPHAVADSATTTAGVAVVIHPLANDTAGASTPAAPLDPTTVRLLTGTPSAPVTSLVLAGDGTFTVDTTTGHITFTPLAGFTGSVPAVTYTVADSNGTRTTATVSVTVAAGPAAAPDTATTPQGVAVTVPVLANDSVGPSGAALDPSSVTLTDPVTGLPVPTVTVAGEGTYTVNSDGSVRFTPESGFVGSTTPLSYTMADTTGAPAGSTLHVIVNRVARNDVASTSAGTPVQMNPTSNDSPGTTAAPIIPTSVRLIDPTTGTPTMSVTVPNQGIFTVDPSTGIVTFTPQKGFVGEVAAVSYAAGYTDGTSVTASMSITVLADPATAGLAYTGVNAVPQILSALLMLLGGAALILFAAVRRRAGSSPSAARHKA